nr:hypothetical protein [Tanacetum cinerariifolium]
LRNGLALANGESLVLVGVSLESGLEKQVARHGRQRGQHPLVADAALLAQQRKQGPALAAVAIRIAVGRNRRNDKRNGWVLQAPGGRFWGGVAGVGRFFSAAQIPAARA